MADKPFWQTERDLTDAEQERLMPDTDFEADNPDGAAESISSASALDFSPQIEQELEDRAEAIQTTNNDPDIPDRFEDDVFRSEERAEQALFASFSRGLGAAEGSRGVDSPVRWGYARTADFSAAVKTGSFDDDQYDLDLLPDGHPLASRGDGDQPFVEGEPSGDERERIMEVFDR